jgi:hypothetical protein
MVLIERPQIMTFIPSEGSLMEKSWARLCEGAPNDAQRKDYQDQRKQRG